MKTSFIILLLSLISITTYAQDGAEKPKNMDQKVLRHVVLFQWNDGTSEETLKKIQAAFSALPAKIPEILDFEFGLNNSPEGLDKGFTHCYLITFADEKAREIYLPHPDHQAFVKLIGDHVKDVLVVDYWTD